MRLLRDPHELARLLKQNAREDYAVPVEDTAAWLADPRHFALVEGDDLGLCIAGDEWPGPLNVHVFFASRGKQALETATAMIEQAFSYGATEMLGETPARYRDALLFVRLLGFQPYGERIDDGETLILGRLLHHNCRGRKKAA